MKKMLFFAAMSAIALTSCVNEDDFSGENQQLSQELKFDAPVMKQTRANVNGEISGVKYPEAENFVVFCKSYKNGFKGWTSSDEISNYFNANGEIAKSGYNASYWATDIVHYWPETEYNLAFAAYSPADMALTPAPAVSHTENGLQITDFKTQAKADDQYDLMYTQRNYDLNKAVYANSAVPLAFRHALSSIVFSTQKSSSDVKYEITKIQIDGKFCQQADFDQNITETYAGGAYSENENPTWKNLEYTGESVNYVPTLAGTVDVPVEAPLQFTSGTSALLLIPQEVPEEATITVYYTKTTNPGQAGEKSLSTSATIKLREFFHTNSGVKTYVTEWERGKRYIYRIAFGANTRIYFEPSVTDWVTEPTLVYTIQ
ncbi:MAG: fimbrillin family protein [Bacteroidaceae bacterium]|nr:fimbrillin family protein [Bacteroidaceae bacterium]